MGILNIRHKDRFIKIELLDTPLVKIWKEQFYKVKDNLNRISVGTLFPHTFTKDDSSYDKGVKYVEKINTAIAKLNTVIAGRKYPYFAYYGMPWSHTNRMHRCFTLGQSTEKVWEHTFTKFELAQYKKDAYKNKTLALQSLITTSEFKVLILDEFRECLEIINHNIHLYEALHFNKRCDSILSKQGDSSHLVYNVNNTLDTGVKWNVDYARISYDDLKKSFRQGYLIDCNVFTGWEITGKCYEICYSNYDDPTEYDITNLDHIDGCFTIMDKRNNREFYENSHYMDWIKNHDILEQEMVLPPPIGKVIERNFDSNDITLSTDTYPDGTLIPNDPFGSAELWIDE